MANGDQTDDAPNRSHIAYRVYGRKQATDGCDDEVDATVHDRATADTLTRALESCGFSIQLERRTNLIMRSTFKAEEAPDDVKDGGSPPEEPPP